MGKKSWVNLTLKALTDSQELVVNYWQNQERLELRSRIRDLLFCLFLPSAMKAESCDSQKVLLAARKACLKLNQEILELAIEFDLNVRSELSEGMAVDIPVGGIKESVLREEKTENSGTAREFNSFVKGTDFFAVCGADKSQEMVDED